jgi:two-component system OmpR family response regulator/two-component system response regulator MprA
MRILLVEDERKMASFIRMGLEEEGYQVDWVPEGQPAVARVLAEHYDLVLLDLRLPDISGIEVCRKIRVHNADTPILMLTALDAVEDRVKGLRAGADDYLPKPFAFEELLARIEALGRRWKRSEQASLADAEIQIDPAARTCTILGDSIELTHREFDLLAYFVSRPGQALTRDEIHRNVWGHDFDRGTNLIDVYVGYLRHKLTEAGARSSIESVRGVGYRYAPAVESSSVRDEES